MSGYLWAILSGLGFGLFQAFNKRASLVLDYRVGTFGLLLASSLILILASLVTKSLSLVSSISLTAAAYFALAGIIQFSLGWTFLTLSQKKVGAPRTSALVSTAPLFAIMVGILFLGEVLNWITVLGIIMVVAGISLLTSD